MIYVIERQTRLELATPTLARSCSTNWAIAAISSKLRDTGLRLSIKQTFYIQLAPALPQRSSVGGDGFEPPKV